MAANSYTVSVFTWILENIFPMDEKHGLQKALVQ